MISLRPRAVRKLSDAIARLYVPVEDGHFASQAIDVLATVFPETLISFDTVSNRTGAHRHTSNFSVANQQEWLERLGRRMHVEHPSVAYVRAFGPKHVLRLLELISAREFRDTGLYCEHFRPLQAVDQLAAVVPDPECVIGFAVNRSSEFGEKDVEVLGLLRPHLVQAYRNARLFSALQHVVDDPEEALQPDDKTPSLSGLTPRESEVLRWLSEGKRDREIAIILGSTPRTVEKHVQRILAKLRVATRAGAAALVAQKS